VQMALFTNCCGLQSVLLSVLGRSNEKNELKLGGLEHGHAAGGNKRLRMCIPRGDARSARCLGTRGPGTQGEGSEQEGREIVPKKERGKNASNHPRNCTEHCFGKSGWAYREKRPGGDLNPEGVWLLKIRNHSTLHGGGTAPPVRLWMGRNGRKKEKAWGVREARGHPLKASVGL